MYQYRVNEVKLFVDKLVTSRESGTIMGLPKSGSFRTLQYVLSELGYEDRFHVFDLSIMPQRCSEFENLTNTLFHNFAQNNISIVVVDQLNLHSKSGRKKLKFLRSQRQLYQNKFQYVFIFSEDIYLRQNSLVKRKYTDIIFQNTLYFPYATKLETDVLIKQNSTRYGFEIDGVNIDLIHGLSGGCPYIIKNLCRRIAEKKALDIDDDAIFWGSQVLNQLHPDQRLTLKCSNRLDPSVFSMQKMGLFDNNFIITSKVILKAFEQNCLTPKLKINVDKKEIIVNEQKNPSDFSPSDVSILIEMYNSKRVSRSQIAQICYGRDDQYSDYAIDKIISRLRQKMVQLGFSKDVIKAQRGYGYSLNI